MHASKTSIKDLEMLQRKRGDYSIEERVQVLGRAAEMYNRWSVSGWTRHEKRAYAVNNPN